MFLCLFGRVRAAVAKAEQIKSLIQSHLQGEGERFLTTALQLAAHEAHKGNTSFAHEIRSIIDKQKKPTRLRVVPAQGDLGNLISTSTPRSRLIDIVLKSGIRDRISRVIAEFYQRGKLLKHGLANRRKILLVGPPGTGKTMTATVLAGELKLPLHTIQMDRVVTKFMGETSAKLRQIFEVIQESEGLFLFDEFDAIGSERGSDNDVGEMRRVLSSFLQFIEADNSQSIILAATNNINLLDQALFRRFDDVLHYGMPSAEEATTLIEHRLANFRGKFKASTVLSSAQGLSHAEITQACYDAMKEVILNNKNNVSQSLLTRMLEHRKSAYPRGNHA